MKSPKLLKNEKLNCNIIILAIITASILLAIYVFNGAYIDLVNASKSFWQNMLNIFSIANGGTVQSPAPAPIPPSEGNSPNVPNIPMNIEIFEAQMLVWGNILITGDSYIIFIHKLINFALPAITVLSFAVPSVILLRYIICWIYFRENNNHGKKTLPLRAYKLIAKYTINPVSNCINAFIQNFHQQPLRWLLYAIWIFNLAIPNMLIYFIGAYLYYFASFDFLILYELLKFIIYNLKYIALSSPFVFIPILIYCIDKKRVKLAVDKLEKFEEHNKGILKSREISTYKYGPMGTFKTYTLTDEALSLSVMDIEQAGHDMSLIRKMFPKFPWLLFELELEENKNKHQIYNWSSAFDYVHELKLHYEQGEHNLYNYKEAFKHYNGICVVDLFRAFEDYARLHFLYNEYGSHIISNYAIREDRIPYSKGNSIKWDNSFFRFDKGMDNSFYSKILNFDILRMGKTMKEANINKSLEFGVICITEADKEQANSLETINDNPNSPYPNPKNDGMTRTEKFIRHRATVMGHCYAHILKDGQRVMSINADTRQIGGLEEMMPPTKMKYTLKMFAMESWLYDKYQNFYEKFDEEHRYYRGDDTLFHYILTILDSKLYNYIYTRRNRYGYRIISKGQEIGTLKGDVTIVKYYLCNAKILADRYNTATLERFFMDRSKSSQTGLDDYKSYQSTIMTDEDFNEHNSYVRLAMTNPDWTKPIIDKANEEKMIKEFEFKEMQKLLKEKLKNDMYNI